MTAGAFAVPQFFVYELVTPTNFVVLSGMVFSATIDFRIRWAQLRPSFGSPTSL
jgi:hypothetical protein